MSIDNDTLVSLPADLSDQIALRKALQIIIDRLDLITLLRVTTDNAILRADGKEGQYQDSLVQILDSGALKFANRDLTTTSEAGVLEYADGHFYISGEQAARHAITRSDEVKTTTTEVTNTTVETTIYSKVFAANELHIDEVVSILLSGVYSNAPSSDDFSIRLKVNGVTIHTLPRVGGNVTDVGWETLARFTVKTPGISGTYVDFFKFTESGSPPYSGADSSAHIVDTTIASTFTVTMQWDNAKAGNTFFCTQGFTQLNH